MVKVLPISRRSATLPLAMPTKAEVPHLSHSDAEGVVALKRTVWDAAANTAPHGCAKPTRSGHQASAFERRLAACGQPGGGAGSVSSSFLSVRQVLGVADAATADAS